MRRAVEVAAAASEARADADVDDVELVGALAFDPRRRKIVARSCDRRHAHPLRHAAMNLIDVVAQKQGGQPVYSDYSPLETRAESLPPAPEFSYPASEAPASKEAVEAEERYLLTGLDVYLTRAPCWTCAMALVHSRAARLFVGAPHPPPPPPVPVPPESSAPAAAGDAVAQLVWLRALNHHYRVYRNVLRQECLRLRLRPREPGPEEPLPLNRTPVSVSVSVRVLSLRYSKCSVNLSNSLVHYHTRCDYMRHISY